MKSKYFSLIRLIIIILALIAGILSRYVTHTNDSAVEQVAEAILETEGVDINFSPNDNDTVEVCND